MADTLSAIADLIWPLLLLGLLAFLYSRREALGREVKELVGNREVTAQLPGGIGFAIGKQTMSAQQAVDGQRRHTDELRQELSLLAAQVAELRATVTPSADADFEPDAPITEPLTRRVLWVDDRPSENAYEIAALQDSGVDVDIASSTAEALRCLAHDQGFDAIVTDMHRIEGGESRDTAGLALLSQLRQRRIEIPVVVYAAQRRVERHGRDALEHHRREALELGAMGATASSTALLELLAVNYGPQFSTLFERQVQGELKRSGWDPVPESPESPIGFTARRDGKVLGVDVASWGPHVGADRLRTKLDAIERARFDFPVWIVTPEDARIPPTVSCPKGVELMTFDDLRARLGDAALSGHPGGD